MQPTRTLLAVLVFGSSALLAAGAAQRPTRDDLWRQVAERREKITREINQARDRVKHKNFLAARSATQDARDQIERLRRGLPWQPLVRYLDSAEKNVRARLFRKALQDIDKAFRELDYQAQFIRVGAIWQHLEAARDACRDKNEDVGRSEIRRARDLAAIDEVLLPIRRADGHLADAADELLKLPIFFKGKRDDIVESYDKAEAELRQAFTLIDELIAGTFSEEPPDTRATGPDVPTVPPLAP